MHVLTMAVDALCMHVLKLKAGSSTASSQAGVTPSAHAHDTACHLCVKHRRLPPPRLVAVASGGRTPLSV